ncbi:MAG TPA: hypothetical protein VKS22_01790 [Candidatus Binataceae bacterium]|nr:hypothetical protein [Candidatus Binataceae bacterium]
MQLTVTTVVALLISAFGLIAMLVVVVSGALVNSIDITFKRGKLSIALLLSAVSLVAIFDVSELDFELHVEETAREHPTATPTPSNTAGTETPASTARTDIPDLREFAAQVGLAGPMRLDYLESKIRDIIAATKCHKDGSNGEISFTCDATPDPDVSSCSLRWPLNPIKGDGPDGLAVVEGRTTVISQEFSGGGYALFNASDTGGEALSAIGIAPVVCNDVNSEFRLAFVLSNAEELNKYKSAFRTRGYDWITPRYKPVPYLPEIFAMASLREISNLIRDDTPQNALVASDKRVLLNEDAIKVLRRVSPQEITVGNNSNFRLGVSRGACILAMRAANYPFDRDIQVAPSEYSRTYDTLAPSLVIFPPRDRTRSVPCPLMISWLSIDATPEDGLPEAFSSPELKYKLEAGIGPEENIWRGYAIRTAAVMLYMLGYEVRSPTGDKLGVVSGQWPRKALLTPAAAH